MPNKKIIFIYISIIQGVLEVVVFPLKKVADYSYYEQTQKSTFHIYDLALLLLIHACTVHQWEFLQQPKTYLPATYIEWKLLDAYFMIFFCKVIKTV